MTITKAPPELLKGLPLDDQEAIQACVEAPGIFVGVDPYGNLEIEFNRPPEHYRTIWLDHAVVISYETGK